MIEAKIIADSLAPCGKRLTTFVCTYNRYILAEINTHRMLSRNSASSRAIPVEKMISSIESNPAIPVSWGKNQKGMQANEEISKELHDEALRVWIEFSGNTILCAERLLELGIHKQIANRVMEPFAHTTSIISATEWENFFALRCHKDAQPEFQALAFSMLEAYLDSKPKELKEGEWHIPFGDKYTDNINNEPLLLKIATARCARVSYKNFEGDIDYEKDYKLHDDLLTSGHFSPFEHCGRAENQCIRSGNFIGFTQYRKTLVGEVKTLARCQMEQILLEYKNRKVN